MSWTVLLGAGYKKSFYLTLDKMLSKNQTGSPSVIAWMALRKLDGV